MKVEKYKELFETTINLAVQFAEEVYQIKLPSAKEFLIHGADHREGYGADEAAAFEMIYLDDMVHWSDIMIGVKSIDYLKKTTLFMILVPGYDPKPYPEQDDLLLFFRPIIVGKIKIYGEDGQVTILEMPDGVFPAQWKALEAEYIRVHEKSFSQKS